MANAAVCVFLYRWSRVKMKKQLYKEELLYSVEEP